MAPPSRKPDNASARACALASSTPSSPTPWRLVWRGRTVELREGTLVVGRGPTCGLLLGRPTVSRVHARLHVTQGGVAVEDLNSANGVFVNGFRVQGSRGLRHEDRILFGTEEVLLVSSEEPERLGAESGPVAIDRRDAEQPEPKPQAQDPAASSPSSWRRAPPRSAPPLLTTQKADAFQLLGRLVDRMLAAGRHDVAVRILSDHMRSLLDGARTGQRLDAQVVEGSTRYALKLAGAANDAQWADYVVEVHMALRRPLPLPAARQLAGLLHNGMAIDRDLFLRYKDVLRTELLDSDEVDPVACVGVLSLELPRAPGGCP
jgi:pSer/pThr/pTyr-binding forkhead associated (FHA) protein